MAVHVPRLSIGVLAHNEASHIGKTLQTLFAQDVFQKLATEVVIVANGCTDETAAVARRSLADHQAVWSTHGCARVEEIVVAGKSNAWNQFVHKFSSSQASVLVLMDADIALLNSNTISSMVTTLENTPQAVVCVDQPVKDIEIKPNLTFFERLLLSATPKIDPNNVPLCGQLYCALSASVRQIKLPIAIPFEDGLLRGLLLTQGFTAPEDPRRIVLDSSVAHRFASVATLEELFKHEVWIVAGSIVSMLLFERFWAECAPDRSAMTLMNDWQDRDPEWLQRYVESQVQERGWRLLPRHWWTRRWSRLGKPPAAGRLRRFLVAIIATAMDALIFIAAIRDVRHGRAFRYWRSGPTAERVE
jgi:glycosyltransferase involved in cell wall biosynthesis